MKKTFNIYLLLFGLIFISFSSCDSNSDSEDNNNNPCQIETPIPTAVNTTVYQADIIELSVQEPAGYYVNYHWIGPNGFESFEREPKIRFATTEMSGEYKVKFIIEDCESEFVSVNVNVIEPTAPCNLTNNTSVLTTYGTKQITSASVSNYNSNYNFTCSGPQLTYNIEFSKNELPLPGIYKIVESFSIITQNEVRVNGNYSNYYFATNDGYIYVKYDSNNKMNVKFCNVNFEVIYNYIPNFTASLNATDL